MRHLITPVLAVSVMILSTAPAQADVGDQLFKLLPDDGEEGDQFGRTSVAINSAVAIVAAWLNDDNGTWSGSAYLFDITTGRQLFKLLPNDGAEGDLFGISVAISPDSIGTAIVGAFHDNDNGENSGSAYLFDTATGKQIAELLPDDGAVDDFFGVSLAISGTNAIVGAEGARGKAGATRLCVVHPAGRERRLLAASRARVVARRHRPRDAYRCLDRAAAQRECRLRQRDPAVSRRGVAPRDSRARA